MSGFLEMDATLLAAAVAAVSSIIVALVQKSESKKRREREADEERYREERAEADKRRELIEVERRHMDKAMHEGMFACLEGVEVSLIALRGGNLNGNVENALSDIDKAKATYNRTRDKVVTNLL